MLCVSCGEAEADPRAIYDDHCRRCDDARDEHEQSMTLDRRYAESWRQRQREMDVRQYGARGE